MSHPAASPGLSLAYIDALAVGKRARGAAIGLLFYDHLISLDREIHLVWARDKTRPAFWLYMFNRFFAFLYYVWDCIPFTPSGLNTSKICVIYLMCDGIVTTVATLAVQIILQLRIYALYEQSRKVLIFLIIACSLEIAAMGILIAVTMSHLRGLPILSTNTGCAYQGLLSVSSLFWLPGLVYEPVLFALVAYKAWGGRSDEPRVPLIRRMARDSLVYFAVVFAELLVNTTVWARAPQYINIVNPWSAALPSLLGSRLMLSMREAVYRRGSPDSYILETFASSVVPAGHRRGVPWADSGTLEFSGADLLVDGVTVSNGTSETALGRRGRAGAGKAA